MADYQRYTVFNLPYCGQLFYFAYSVELQNIPRAKRDKPSVFTLNLLLLLSDALYPAIMFLHHKQDVKQRLPKEISFKDSILIFDDDPIDSLLLDHHSLREKQC